MVEDLRGEIDRYLIGRADLRQLESWLVSRLQSILDSGDARLIENANSLDADLVEYGEGLLDEQALHRRLEAYLRGMETILLDTRNMEVATESGAATIVSNVVELPGGVTTIRVPRLVLA